MQGPNLSSTLCFGGVGFNKMFTKYNRNGNPILIFIAKTLTADYFVLSKYKRVWILRTH